MRLIAAQRRFGPRAFLACVIALFLFQMQLLVGFLQGLFEAIYLLFKRIYVPRGDEKRDQNQNQHYHGNADQRE